jgi:hypothetical protein
MFLWPADSHRDTEEGAWFCWKLLLDRLFPLTERFMTIEQNY